MSAYRETRGFFRDWRAREAMVLRFRREDVVVPAGGAEIPWLFSSLLVSWWDDDGWWQLMADGRLVLAGAYVRECGMWWVMAGWHQAVARAMGGVSWGVRVCGWCQHPSHFFPALIPQKNAQEASRKSTEHSRSERTLAKLLKVIEEHDGTTMTSRSWIISFKSDRDVIVIVTSWSILASQLQEVIEGTLANLLSHRKTRLNHDDVAIARNPFKSDRDMIVIVFSWCFLRHYDQETSVQNKRRQASWFFLSPLM